MPRNGRLRGIPLSGAACIEGLRFSAKDVIRSIVPRDRETRPISTADKYATHKLFTVSHPGGARPLGSLIRETRLGSLLVALPPLRECQQMRAQPSDRKAKLIELGERPFHHPPVSSQPAAVFGVSFSRLMGLSVGCADPGGWTSHRNHGRPARNQESREDDLFVPVRGGWHQQV
jgi:hypothetical protein